MRGIGAEKIIEKNENSVIFDVFIGADCDYFDGHFPEKKLLPAVAQFAIVSKAAEKHFAPSGFVKSIKRMKFQAPIFPDSTVRFSMKKDADKIAFSLFDSFDETKIFSSGSFSLK